MKKIIIILIVVVALAAGAAVYFFVFRNMGEEVEPRIEYPLESFITNISETNRMLKSTIVLVVNDEKAVAILTEQNTVIRDAIIFILRDLTEDEIRTTGRKDELRNKIINALNDKLAIDNIVEVRFNDFVMQ